MGEESVEALREVGRLLALLKGPDPPANPAKEPEIVNFDHFAITVFFIPFGKFRPSFWGCWLGSWWMLRRSPILRKNAGSAREVG